MTEFRVNAHVTIDQAMAVGTGETAESQYLVVKKVDPAETPEEALSAVLASGDIVFLTEKILGSPVRGKAGMIKIDENSEAGLRLLMDIYAEDSLPVPIDFEPVKGHKIEVYPGIEVILQSLGE